MGIRRLRTRTNEYVVNKQPAEGASEAPSSSNTHFDFPVPIFYTPEIRGGAFPEAANLVCMDLHSGGTSGSGLGMEWNRFDVPRQRNVK